jgi:hypothetical protein
MGKSLELVHDDLCGPITVSTSSGRCWFVLIDGATWYMWVVLLAANVIKHVQATIEKECGHKPRVLRTDNGGEFTPVEFTAYYANEGILRHYFAPYSLQ